MDKKGSYVCWLTGWPREAWLGTKMITTRTAKIEKLIFLMMPWKKKSHKVWGTMRKLISNFTDFIKVVEEKARIVQQIQKIWKVKFCYLWLETAIKSEEQWESSAGQINHIIADPNNNRLHSGLLLTPCKMWITKINK